MIDLAKVRYVKWVAVILALLLLYQPDCIFCSESQTDNQKEFRRAVTEYDGEHYQDSIEILERLIDPHNPLSLRAESEDEGQKKLLGKTYLLLGASYEKLYRQENKYEFYQELKKYYEKAKEILREYDEYTIEGIDLNDLPCYKETFIGSGETITKEKVKLKPPNGKKRLLPLILVGTVLLAAIVYFLLKKGSSSDTKSQNPSEVSVRIESTPSKAKVYVDGHEKGSATPCTFNVQPGSRVFKLVNEHCGEAVKTINVESNMRYVIKATLSGYEYKYVSHFGGFGGGRGQLQRPTGIYVDHNNFVYVCDTQNHRIQKFGPSGDKVFAMWGTQGDQDGYFNGPRGITGDTDDYIYVSDSQNNRIQKFTNFGQHKNTWGPSGNWSGRFDFPIGLEAYDKTELLYVVDSENHRVLKLDQRGNSKGRWGSYGAANGKFNYPYDIAVGSAGNVYVTDTENHRIQKFGPSGGYMWAQGSKGSGKGKFNKPRGIAVNSHDCIYVVDCNNHRVQKFYHGEDEYVTQWGSRGSGPGQFLNPEGIAVDKNDIVYVTDTGNHRIQKFKITKQTENNGDWNINKNPTLSSGFMSTSTYFPSGSKNNHLRENEGKNRDKKHYPISKQRKDERK
jgi:DNA-binding beta-propeller fold protein YncE